MLPVPVPEPPPPGLVPSCAEGGVLGVLPGIIGAIQAMETIKLILGTGEPLAGRLLLFDALAMHFRELRLRKNPACPICGEHRTIDKLIDYEEFCGIRGEEAAPVTTGIPEITPREPKTRLDRGDDLYILDVREPHEYQICNLHGNLIPLGQLPQPRASSSTVPAKSSLIAAAESARPTLSSFCARPAFRRFGT